MGVTSVPRPTVGRRPIQGFTLIELLIAAAILMVILTALTGFLISSNRGYRVTEQISDRQQEIEAAVKVMSYDLGLAGYLGTTPSDLARSFAEPTLALEKGVDGGDSDRLLIRYYEDSGRLFGADNSCGSPCLVTYEVGVGDDGETYLYRKEGNSEEKGIVQAVEYFKIREYLNRDGTLTPLDEGTALPSDLAGLNIEIAFTNGGLWRFPVGISNLQHGS